MPQIMKGIVEMTQRAPHERERVVEQIGCMPGPKIKEDVVDGIHVVPGVAEKAGLLGLAKKTRFTAEHWEGQVYWDRGDQACAVDTVGLNIKGLSKYNMPQSGDVMVPVPQIQGRIVDVGGQEQVIDRS